MATRGIIPNIPNIKPIKWFLLGVYAPVKTLKTTFGLTMPKPMIDFDFDQSFDRAEAYYRAVNPAMKIRIVEPDEPLSQAILNEEFDIIVRKYLMPFRLPGRKVFGYTGLWDEQVIAEMIMAYQDPKLVSVLGDTGTVFWEMARMANLERTQASSDKERIQNIRIEYARPNIEARTLIAGPKGRNKHLVLLHHMTDRYENKEVVGTTWQGFKEMGQIVDVVSEMYMTQTCRKCKKPITKSLIAACKSHPKENDRISIMEIRDCGYTLSANNSTIINPTFSSVLALVNAIRMTEVMNLQASKNGAS